MHTNCPLITAVSGFCVLALGAISSWYMFPVIINSQIHKNIDLVDGTQAYTFWKKQPFPLKFKLYFFNVSNPDAVQMGANPILKEIGPYVYDEFRERVEVSVNEDKDVLKYILRKTFFFNQTDSGRFEQDDMVTIINAALVGTALQVNQMLPTALPTISDSIPYLYPGTKNIFLTAKVRDIAFDGIRLYCQDKAVEFVCTAMRGQLPKTIKVAENGKDFLFSMFGHLNGSDDGPWEMGRGLKNTTRGEIYSYEEMESMEIWGDSYCNQINGSDSTVFPTVNTAKREPRLYSFVQDFCRSLYVNYERESSEFGLPSIRYTSHAESLAINDENNCFCPIETDDEGDDEVKCPIGGTADITPCFKAPVLISYPHFYLGDKRLLKYVTGLKPQKALHENYVNLEPRTGTPLSGRKRVQINIELKRLEGFELLLNVSEGVFPVLWLEEGVTLPADVAEFLSSNLSKAGLLDMAKWIMIMTGVGLMLVAFGMVMKKEKLLCFGNNATVDITTTKNGGGDVNAEHEMNPNLYPQLDHKNTSDQFSRNRPNQWNPNAWSRHE